MSQPQAGTTARSNVMLKVETTTWNRDSHELFDYESRHVFNKKYFLRKGVRVFRSALDVSVSLEGAELPQNSDYLLSVKSREGKYYVYPAERNFTGAANAINIQPRKLWLVVKHLQRATFPLTEGDVIKLGRFKLKVKQVVNEADGSNPQVDFKLDDGEAPATELSTEEAVTMQCRICLLEGAEELDPLVRACQCKGSIMYVHLECLRHWVNSRLNLTEDPARSCCFVKQVQCELCKATFPSFVLCKGAKLPVVRIPNVQPPFIVLENMVGPTNRGVHLCSMSIKKECKLGRGHESDVRIADVSISRFHAIIRHLDGSFYLEDHSSKFGTLVAIRKPTVVERVENLSVQVGRTVLRFALEETQVPLTIDLLDATEASEQAAQDSDPNDSTRFAHSPDPNQRAMLNDADRPDGSPTGYDSSQQLVVGSTSALRMSPFGVHLNQFLFNSAASGPQDTNSAAAGILAGNDPSQQANAQQLLPGVLQNAQFIVGQQGNQNQFQSQQSTPSSHQNAAENSVQNPSTVLQNVAANTDPSAGNHFMQQPAGNTSHQGSTHAQPVNRQGALSHAAQISPGPNEAMSGDWSDRRPAPGPNEAMSGGWSDRRPADLGDGPASSQI